MRIEVVASLAAVSPSDWNRLVASADGNVFLSYEYLHSLHESGCATARTGWQPHYLLAFEDDALVGAMPLYQKYHSYGEYVFDWAWADAYKRAGGSYYPKLLAAVPFTPCAGPRVLAARDDVRDALIAAAVRESQQLGLSSLHVLLPHEGEQKRWVARGMLAREGVQFHWTNLGYESFDAMLAQMSHDKRKRIKQDRRYVREAGIQWRIQIAPEISEADLRFFYRCYENTYAAHYSTPYLSIDFFRQIVAQCGPAVVLFVGERDGQPVAVSLCIQSGARLYGRYWGSTESIRSLHFEACYYTPISWCIERGIKCFEGGAQGAHKLARGLLPVTTYSSHCFSDPRFSDAVEHFLHREKIGMMHTMEELSESSPFKTAAPAEPM
ncbi:MAG: N-acetyltransferase [Betaproteobacteria bacterium]|nr:MAG: N-acetyltransferase [Betaproteobacteria bacterium]